MKQKTECPYKKRCCDYKRFKELCHIRNWIYCITFIRLNKKEEEIGLGG